MRTATLSMILLVASLAIAGCLRPEEAPPELAAPPEAGTSAAGRCSDVFIFSRNSKAPTGVNPGAVTCSIPGQPLPILPATDVVIVRYSTKNFHPGTGTLYVTLDGLGFSGTGFTAWLMSSTNGPDVYDTDHIVLPQGLTSSGTLTATVYNEARSVILGSVTYATSDKVVAGS